MNKHNYSFNICNKTLTNIDLIRNTLKKLDKMILNNRHIVDLTSDEQTLIYSVLRNYKLDIFGTDI